LNPEAPGWYPDPDSGRMRRWDGSRWTGESRDLPPWAPTAVDGGPGPSGRRGPAKHWIVLAAVVGFVFLAVSYQAWNSGVDLPPRTVTDEAFITAANEQCRAELTPLKEARPRAGTPEGRDPGPDAAVADRVDDADDRLSDLADDLRGLARQSPDEADVQTWLAEWDHYAEVGHDYADAVRDGDSRQRQLASEGATSGQRADLFARGNGLKDCTFA